MSRWIARWIVVLSATTLVGHGYLCWRMIGGVEGLLSPYPILRDDHSFNYYYAVRTRDFLSRNGSTAGYDPSFMAGNAKSIIFPSSSTLAEVAVFLFGGDRPERAYKAFVFLVMALAPALFWRASWIWCRDSATSATAHVFFLAYFWTDWGFKHVVFGMVSFLLAGPATLLALACLVRLLERWGEPASSRSRFGAADVGLWLRATIATAFACLVHVTAPVVLAPAFLAAYVRASRNLSPLAHLSLWLSAIAVVVGNAFWLVPGIVLWQTKSATDLGFVNPNVLRRFAELIDYVPHIEQVVLVFAPIGLWSCRRQPVRFLALSAGLGWVFFLSYPAGWVRQLDFLQPSRSTLYLYTWGGLAAAEGMTTLCQFLMRSALWARLSGFLLGGAVAALVVSEADAVRIVATNDQPSLVSTMPSLHQTLIDVLRKTTRPGERIFFEDCNRGIHEDGKKMLDPFDAYRLSPLIPLLTRLEVVGGPYLYTHLDTNFSQFGDGYFLSAERIDPERFEFFAEAYDVAWIVCWSPASRQFCDEHPELVKPAATVGDPPSQFFVGRLERERKPIVEGTGELFARRGYLEARKIRPVNGRVILRYHYVPGLVIEPSGRLKEFRVENDPVGLIEVEDPPERFRIHLNPWPWPMRYQFDPEGASLTPR